MAPLVGANVGDGDYGLCHGQTRCQCNGGSRHNFQLQPHSFSIGKEGRDHNVSLPTIAYLRAAYLGGCYQCR